MAASPPPTKGQSNSIDTLNRCLLDSTGDTEITPSETELGNMEMAGDKGCSADTHLIPPTEIKVAGAEDGNSTSANPKIQPTEAEVGEEKAGAMGSTSWLGRFGQLYLALRSLLIRASPVKTETDARDGNSSAASPKIQPSHTASACGKTSWFYAALLSLVVNKQWLEGFYKLNPGQ